MTYLRRTDADGAQDTELPEVVADVGFECGEEHEETEERGDCRDHVEECLWFGGFKVQGLGPGVREVEAIAATTRRRMNLVWRFQGSRF
jgi:hypothetical protein